MVDPDDWYLAEDSLRTDDGLITQVNIVYDCEGSRGILEATYGSRSGASEIEREFGENDIVYTVKPQNLDVTDKQEHYVPEPIARGSVEQFVNNILSGHLNSDGSDWQCEELDGLGI